MSKKKTEGSESVVLTLEPSTSDKPSSGAESGFSGGTSSTQIQKYSTTNPDSPEANSNKDTEEHHGSMENDGTNEDGYSNLEKDYEKDYQTVLRLKQQMAKHELNPLKQGRRSVFSRLTMPKRPKEFKLLAFVVLLFVVIIVGLVIIYHFHEEEFYYIYRGENIIVNEKTLDIEVSNAQGNPVLFGHLWRSRPSGKLPYDCSDAYLKGQGLCLLWRRLERLEIHHQIDDNVTCYDVRWKALSPEVKQLDCFELKDDHWYGGGISPKVHSWPLERSSFSKRPFVSGTAYDTNGFGPVIERYWLNSKGVAIVVNENSPLHISINSLDPIFNQTDGQLCIYSDYSGFSYPKVSDKKNVDLNYTICVGNDIQQVHSMALSLVGNKRQGRPPSSIFVNPVWSTWSFLKEQYNQSSLETYVRQINDSGLRHSLLMIDDGWEERYGDMTFVASRFHDPKQMIRSIHESGFQVSLWSHPQLNTDSISFQHATLNSLLLQGFDGDVPGLTRWWNGPRTSTWVRGVAGVIGVSQNATKWQRQRLNHFKIHHDIDSFHFVGGEVSSLPAHPAFDGTIIDPNDYTRLNAELASSFGNLVSVQSAYKSQHLPILIRLGDGTSTWNNTGGLETIIQTVLTLGLVGYPFFIPEAIGGSAYDEFPSKELYIRWLQLSTFLPIMHFSIPPFHYDDETMTLAKELVELHSNLVVPEVISVMDESIEKLTPVVRPIWWNAKGEEEALTSSTEFMVGENILVAPVVVEGARSRDIYLTEGLWEDKLNSKVVHLGPIWLYDYDVPLNKVPYFIRK